MLLVLTLAMFAAFGATVADMQPSALRLLVTAVIGLLAPLSWPGNAATPVRTALRIAAWSAAAAGLAAIALRLLGDPVQPFSRIFGSCAMLMLVLLVTHAVASALEGRWRARSVDAEVAREMAGRTVTVALALLGSMPVWLGPLGELLSRRHAWIVDAVVGISPLTHLAVASGNDLLRNQWFYQHSNLASLRFSYPALSELIVSYAAACLVLGALAFRRPWHPPRPATPTHSTKEKTR